MNRRFRSLSVLTALMLIGWNLADESPTYPTIGSIERLDPRLDALIPANARIERLTESIADWAEGPVWLPRENCLIFSDVPKNLIWKWQEGRPPSVFLKPSGYTGAAPFRGREPGSNGLALDAQGRLVLCQHGDRRVARRESDGNMTVLVDRFEGKRFNSPNDLCIASNGDIYFTDPPYGLAKVEGDPAKELDFHGVFRLKPDGSIALLTKELSRPNGIALSPDEKTLYVANSDSKRAIWMAYPIREDGRLGEGRVFFDATQRMAAGFRGAPDGLKVDRQGHLFATGPGGVLVFAPDGTHLGTIQTGEPTANCGWGDDGSVLYMTANKFLCRIRTSTKGR